MANQHRYNLSDQESREEIKDAIFLVSGKHILDEHAEQILHSYKGYINNNYISLFIYAVDYYTNQG
jgi:hypothetical protein